MCVCVGVLLPRVLLCDVARTGTCRVLSVPVWGVTAVGVAAHHRGKGAAGALLRTALRDAQLRGLVALALQATTEVRRRSVRCAKLTSLTHHHPTTHTPHPTPHNLHYACITHHTHHTQHTNKTHSCGRTCTPMRCSTGRVSTLWL